MTHCEICGRTLKDRKSIKHRLGPSCYKKHLKEIAKAEFLKIQIPLFDINKIK